MTDNKELQDLYRNYTELEIENQDKLLLVGKKLLGVKKIVMSDDVSGDNPDELKLNTEKIV